MTSIRYDSEPDEIDINSSAAELRNYTLAIVPLLDIDIPIVQFYSFDAMLK